MISGQGHLKWSAAVNAVKEECEFPEMRGIV